MNEKQPPSEEKRQPKSNPPSQKIYTPPSKLSPDAAKKVANIIRAFLTDKK